ncbi:MAG: hypothetical protein KIH64_007485 [Mycobacterium sp.]|nr:hypothetical protein [Mycobacterium sp.]
MTESSNATAQSTTLAESARSRDADHRDRRLHRTLAWVGIVAGVVFTVAVIFFSGVAVGRSTGYGWHRGYHTGQMGPGGGCPMMGGMMGPGGRMDPDDRGPGMMRPSQSPGPASPAPGR